MESFYPLFEHQSISLSLPITDSITAETEIECGPPELISFVLLYALLIRKSRN